VDAVCGECAADSRCALSIGKNVLTPKKKARRIIDNLPDTATWDHIQKKIEAAAKAADMARKIS
jgi:hypothetical protein